MRGETVVIMKNRRAGLVVRRSCRQLRSGGRCRSLGPSSRRLPACPRPASALSAPGGGRDRLGNHSITKS